MKELYYQTVTPLLKNNLIKLMKIPQLDEFRLVGGTGLSLQNGYRTSLYIDLFCRRKFVHKIIINSIVKQIPSFKVVQRTDLGITGFIKDNLKIDIYSTNNPFLKNTVLIDGIRFAHIDDIVAMKLEAIINRKEKKDYYDIAFLLYDKKYTLENMVKLFKQKYFYFDTKLVLEELLNTKIMDLKKQDPKCFLKFDWNKTKEIIRTALNEYQIERSLVKKDRSRYIQELIEKKRNKT